MISSLHRPTVAIVDLPAIAENIKAVQAHIPARSKTYAVVKANAYGHGAIAVSRYIRNLVDGFCVSNMDEALELRQAGIDKEILILGVTMPQEFELAIEKQITLTVASEEWLDLALKENFNFENLHVHVKVDSGMGRIGVRSSEEANRLIEKMLENEIQVDGIFTHFATADEASVTKFTAQQAMFSDLVSHLTYRPETVHSSNSAASLWHSASIVNAVRLGIVMYGLNPSGTALKLPYPIKPALSLESALVHVKKIRIGDNVGYGATYTAKADEYIGTIPIGYADGWTRDLQGFEILLDGQKCEIVGRVSMDQTTIRLPRRYPIGTPVTLIGQNGKQEILATDIAQKRGTINYEVLCLLSDRIPRKYD